WFFCDFFFQAEDGIRDFHVTGVQTCALPIYRIYQGPVMAKWQQEFEAMGREFREAFLNTLRPFEPDKTLQKAFYRMFDGIEVLPLSLRNQYQVLFQQEPLTAAELLVPISWHQFLALQRKGLILEDVETDRKSTRLN